MSIIIDLMAITIIMVMQVADTIIFIIIDLMIIFTIMVIVFITATVSSIGRRGGQAADGDELHAQGR